MADSYFLKKGQLVKAETRIEMIELALNEFVRDECLTENYIEIDDWESKQKTWTNTLTVLSYLDQKLNEVIR